MMDDVILPQTFAAYPGNPPKKKSSIFRSFAIKMKTSKKLLVRGSLENLHVGCCSFIDQEGTI